MTTKKKAEINTKYRFFPEAFIFQTNPLNGTCEISEFFQEGKWQRCALILFCCIKCWHITDQFFGPNVKKAARAITTRQCNEGDYSYDDFMIIINAYHLSQFGLICTEGSGPFGYPNYTVDHNFWYRIYEYLKGERPFHCKIDGSMDNLI